MVAPDARRRGIGTALLDAALPLYGGFGRREVLLIVPRPSVAGMRLALRRGGRSTTRSMRWCFPAARSRAQAPAISLRPATLRDLPGSRACWRWASVRPFADLVGRLDSPHGRTVIVDLRGSVIGTLSLTRDGDHAGVYAFVIDPSCRAGAWAATHSGALPAATCRGRTPDRIGGRCRQRPRARPLHLARLRARYHGGLLCVAADLTRR